MSCKILLSGGSYDSEKKERLYNANDHLVYLSLFPVSVQKKKKNCRSYWGKKTQQGLTHIFIFVVVALYTYIYRYASDLPIRISAATNNNVRYFFRKNSHQAALRYTWIYSVTVFAGNRIRSSGSHAIELYFLWTLPDSERSEEKLDTTKFYFYYCFVGWLSETNYIERLTSEVR